MEDVYSGSVRLANTGIRELKERQQLGMTSETIRGICEDCRPLQALGISGSYTWPNIPLMRKSESSSNPFTA